MGCAQGAPDNRQFLGYTVATVHMPDSKGMFDDMTVRPLNSLAHSTISMARFFASRLPGENKQLLSLFVGVRLQVK